MSTALSFSISRALRTVFLEVRPTHHTRHSVRTTPCRAACTPTGQHRQYIGRTTESDQPARTVKWNEEIQEPWIQLVDPESSKLAEPRARWDVLNSFDPKVERLVMVDKELREHHTGQKIAVCRIMNIEDSLKQVISRKKVQAKQKRMDTIYKSVKTLEINWNIDQNDLRHRLARAKTFLEEGRRVEIVLARKKRTKVATTEQRTDLVKHITESLESVNGSSLAEPMKGELQKIVQLSFKPKLTSKAEPSSPEAT